MLSNGMLTGMRSVPGIVPRQARKFTTVTQYGRCRGFLVGANRPDVSPGHCRSRSNAARIASSSSRRAASLLGSKLHRLQRLHDDLQDDQACVALVVRRDDLPRRMVGMVARQAMLVGVHIVIPKRAFLDVGGAEFPVLSRLFNAREKPFALLILRQVQEEFDDPRARAVQMPFEAVDGTIAMTPALFSVGAWARRPPPPCA